MKRFLQACMAALLAAVAFPASAGPVEVSFVDADRYADAGNRRSDEATTRQELDRFLHVLGARYLAPGDSLRIEVLDIDLAGESRPTRHGDLRILRGKADVPRIVLRYALTSGGQPVRQAEERLLDLDYAHRHVDATSNEPLYYEKRMLEDWFRERFAAR